MLKEFTGGRWLDFAPWVPDAEYTVLAPTAPTPWLLPAMARGFSTEGRARRVTLLLAATALMCLGDLSLTLTYVTSMGMVESNPIARAVMEGHSPAFVVLWKLATMAVGLGILFWARRTRGAEVATWLCFLVMAGLCVHWLGFTTAISSLPSEYAAMAALDDPRWVSMTP
jgi:hypothetical protein